MSRRAQELAAEGAAFVTATVVHVQRPTSVEPGNVALVLARRHDRGVRRRGLLRAQRARVLAAGDRDAASRCCCGSSRSPRRPRPVRRGRRRRDGPEPVPVRRCDRGVPRARAARAARARRRRHADRGGGHADRRRARLRRRRASSGGDVEPRPGDLALVVAAHGRDELHTLRSRPRGGPALRRPGREPQARHRRARRAPRRRRAGRLARAHRRPRRPRHRRAHARPRSRSRSWRRSSPCAAPRSPSSAAGATAPRAIRPRRRSRSTRSAA